MPYLPALDGLRALSIIFVVLFHLHPRALPGGWIGVDVFFVLSGYLITTILISERLKSGKIRLGRFYFFRLLRLGPALAFLLLVVGVAASLASDHRKEMLQGIASAAFYLSNIVLAYDLAAIEPLDHTWSLSAEEQFYFIWPLIFIALNPGRVRPFLIAAVCMMIAWRLYLATIDPDWPRTQFGLDTRSVALLLGCLMATLKNHRWSNLAARTWPVPAMAFVALISISVNSAIGLSMHAIAAAIFACWMILAARVDNRLSRVLSWPPLVSLGQLSYGVYLWHAPLIFALKWTGGPVASNIYLRDFCVVSGAVAMAVLSRAVVEKPFMKLKERIRHADKPSGADRRVRAAAG